MTDAILARIDAAWDEFLPCLDGLTEERAAQSGVAGYYSVKDILAHLAFWEDHTRAVVETGRHEPIDVESINDRVYTENRDVSYQALKDRLIDGHQRARATFASTAGLTEDDVKDDTWEHWQEHGDQIREWRAATGN